MVTSQVQAAFGVSEPTASKLLEQGRKFATGLNRLHQAYDIDYVIETHRSIRFRPEGQKTPRFSRKAKTMWRRHKELDTLRRELRRTLSGYGIEVDTDECLTQLLNILYEANQLPEASTITEGRFVFHVLLRQSGRSAISEAVYG